MLLPLVELFAPQRHIHAPPRHRHHHPGTNTKHADPTKLHHLPCLLLFAGAVGSLSVLWCACFTHAMAGTTVHSHRPVNVPRLALPSPGRVSTGEELDSPAFKRQITVALGRSHSQRSPRRDVIFNVRHGSMVEKQRVPLAKGPSYDRMMTLSGGCDDGSENNQFSSTR